MKLTHEDKSDIIEGAIHLINDAKRHNVSQNILAHTVDSVHNWFTCTMEKNGYDNIETAWDKVLNICDIRRDDL